ncbi:MAG TPA: hypothetical protein VNJ70_07550 [Thermoanaerobaculia bacterium]|nr:hypothetical protein [Thermoanaerobaculia bacterium]
MPAITITAVVFPQDGMWIAQCLEYNFVSCAATLDELPGELIRQVRAQIEVDLEAGEEPFTGFKKAAPKYWRMYEEVRAHSRPLKPSLLERARALLSGGIDARLFPVAKAA